MILADGGGAARWAARRALQQPRIDAPDMEGMAARQEPHAIGRLKVGLAHGALAVASTSAHSA